MRFTIIIEFVLSGTLILCALISFLVYFSYDSPKDLLQAGDGVVSRITELFKSDSKLLLIIISAVLLTISYIVGITTNILFYFVQRVAITPYIRSKIYDKYWKQHELSKRKLSLLCPFNIINQLKEYNKSSKKTKIDRLFSAYKYKDVLDNVFGRIRLYIFETDHSDKLSAFERMYFYNESMQRLLRGSIIPLFIFYVLFCIEIGRTSWVSYFVAIIGAICCLISLLGFLKYLPRSIEVENEHALRYFVISERVSRFDRSMTE